MRIGLIVLGSLLALVGCVWIGQGANWIAGSFMTGQPIWIAIGAITAAFGASLIWWAIVGYRHFP